MYLSLLIVNAGGDPNRPRPGRRWVANSYRVHQRLCMAFPEAHPIGGGTTTQKPPRSESGSVLFRIEGQNPQRPRVLVQSPDRPDWARCFGNAPFLLAEPPQIRQFEPAFRKADRFQFYLRANPTAKKKVEEKKNGRRVGLVSEEQQIAWFHRKAANAGFSPVLIRLLAARLRTSRRSKQIDPNPHTHLAADYTGILQVNDPTRFRNALIVGIGSAKAYGFGLLSLARI